MVAGLKKKHHEKYNNRFTNSEKKMGDKNY